MKTFWVSMAVLLALVGSCRPPGSSRSSKPRPVPTAAPPSGNRLNVLLITIDTLRADHLGAYGYKRNTSPRLDAFAKEAAVFEQAYTYWPKTRGSFVMMMTGRRPCQNGYSKKHPMLLGFNATLASTLKDAGYATTAVVDNSNLSVGHGYAKGFDRYRELWEEEALATEMERTRATTEDGVRWLAAPPSDRPFFLWLHYVNPHAPYTPPAPFDAMFLDGAAESGPVLKPVENTPYGGVRKDLAVAGRRLGYYVAQYDGEIAAVDQEVGRVLDALAAGPAAANTLVIVTTDHGESLGEHDYYFDHGADLHDPCLRIPLLVRVPGAAAKRSSVLASTLDFLPTVLDAVKVSYPPGLAGRSLLTEIEGRPFADRERLFAENDRNLSGTLDARYKLVAEADRQAFALYDRHDDPAEGRDVARARADVFRVFRRELEISYELCEREWTVTRPLTEGAKGPDPMSAAAQKQCQDFGYGVICN